MRDLKYNDNRDIVTKILHAVEQLQGSFGGGGLVFEEGEITPIADASYLTIPFSDSHSDLPFFAMIMEDDEDLEFSGTNWLLQFYIVSYQALFGSPIKISTSGGSTYHYGRTNYLALSANGSTTASGSTLTSLSSLTDKLDNEHFYAGYSTTIQFKANKHYKWLAIWMHEEG